MRSNLFNVEYHVKDHMECHRDEDEPVNSGQRPVHVKEHHVDKTLLVEPTVCLVKVLVGKVVTSSHSPLYYVGTKTFTYSPKN